MSNILPIGGISSWYDLQQLDPKDPTEFIAWAKLGTVEGVFAFSSTYNTFGSDVGCLSLSAGAVPLCQANATESGEAVANADQWNFLHLTRSDSAALPPQLKRLLFLRGGTEWTMTIKIQTNHALDVCELSFLNNAATRGDAQGSIPVVRFTGPFVVGEYELAVTLRKFGLVQMGLNGSTTGLPPVSMLDMAWNIVP